MHKHLINILNNNQYEYSKASKKESLPAQKGGTPERRIYKMIPALQISASGP
jgi:hypothetical protein